MPIKISELPAGSALSGSEIVPVVQSGVTIRTLVSAFGTYVRGLFTATPATIAEGGTGSATAAAARTALAVVPTGLATASGLTQNTDRLLGRTTAGVGAIEEIAMGVGVAMTAGVLGLNMQTIVNQLTGNVSLNNVANYFTGPTVAQGSTGTWLALAVVTCVDTGGAATFNARLSDGTNLKGSTQITSAGANSYVTIPLIGQFSAPPGNIRVEVKDATAVTGAISANDGVSGNVNSTLIVIRII